MPPTVSIFRSEEMRLCQLFLSSEAAYNCISELGEIGLVQFRDLNVGVNAFQRKFVNEVRRCEEMERKLRYIETQVQECKIEVADTGENPEAPQPREMVDLEATFERLENELREVNGNNTTLDCNFLELTELKYVLESAQSFFDGGIEAAASMTQSLIPEEGARGEHAQLGFVAGVLPREKMTMFERMVWRVSRGNAFLRQHEIPVELKDPSTGKMVRKNVYLIFFQGEKLRLKVKKICEGCHSTMYPCPDNTAERSEMLKGVKSRLADLTLVLSETSDHKQRVLVAAAKHVRVWLIKVRKIKGIYHTLNLFNMDVTNKCLIGEGWIPFHDLMRIKAALDKGTEKSGSNVQPILNVVRTKMDPPTFYRTNKFTSGFQNLIEAYGVGTYRELNPGLYTCVTFPFLFGVMFGDMGHGTIMLLFALWMVLFEKSLKKPASAGEISHIFFCGRYIILMMGCFSIYTGFTYNDIFSKSINIFGTAWGVGPNATEAITEPWDGKEEIEYTLDPAVRQDYRGYPYPFGMDPIWQLGINKIEFQNSYKMKISIIIGVLHMLFGVCLSVANHVHFRRLIDIWFGFIPQVFFLLALFGYLSFLTFFKWANYGAGEPFDDAHQSSCAPAVLIMFINMMLFNKEDPPPHEGCEYYMFNGQKNLQAFLLAGAIACVPVLLLPKPFILRCRAYSPRYQQPEVAAPPVVVVVETSQPSTSSPTAQKQKSESKTNLVQEGGEAGPSEGAGPSGSTAKAVEAGVAQPVAKEGVAPETTVGAGVPAALMHDNEGEHEEFEFSEVFIHQAIHTIEYVLGTISHTASYLRLWALSLAHAQLSEVLWQMVMRIGLAQKDTTGCIMTFLIFAGFAFLTLSILVVMEGLSAFLHTLRLHWVEFCSKFYEAQGYKFQPFAFKKIVEGKEEE